jgi:hypothetical protein
VAAILNARAVGTPRQILRRISPDNPLMLFRVADWYRRLQSRPSFQEAIVRWENPDYLELMKRQGREGWPKIKELITSL